MLSGLGLSQSAMAVPATLSIEFSIPAVREDGDLLDPTEITEFVFYSDCSGVATELFRTTAGGSASTSVDWLDGSAQSLCFSTVDSFGQNGPLSVSYDFIFDAIAAPGAGVITNVSVTCSTTVCRVTVQ